MTLGGDLVRPVHRPSSYAGPGGDAELFGLYFADAGQHLEHRLLRRPRGARLPQPRRRTRARCRATGAHTVWIGDVLIRADADGTDTYELNRNLLLTDGARADSVPNLEIETGEVAGAGHASATGRFDDEQLFYLMARGIPAEEARRLVVRGFFAELLDQIPVRDLRERLGAAVEAELDDGRAPDDFVSACALDRPRRRASALARRDRRRRRSRSCTPSDDGSTRSATSARTPTSRCPRARSTAARIECWLHGSRFDLRTGKPTGLPATEPVPVYPVEVERRRRLRQPDPSNGVTAVSTLEIRDLHVSVKLPEGEPKPILRGVDLTVRPGETHAIMGPNGSGKSTLAYSIAGHPKYTVTGGTVTLDGEDVLAMTVDERARAGLFLAMQYPVEVPGVSVSNFLRTARPPFDGEAPKLRTWVKELKRRDGAAADGPGVRRAQRQRGLLRRREEAARDPAARAAQAEDRDPRRDRLRPRRRRAAGRVARASTGSATTGETGTAADHPLHPDPALHQAGLRARLRRRPDRRGGRPGAGRELEAEGYERYLRRTPDRRRQALDDRSEQDLATSAIECRSAPTSRSWIGQVQRASRWSTSTARHLAEAAAGARRDARALRAAQRQRAPRCTPSPRRRPRRTRAPGRKVAAFIGAPTPTRSSSPRTPPRRSTWSAYALPTPRPRPGDPRFRLGPGDEIVDHRDGAPLQHRAVAAAVRAHRRDAALVRPHRRRPARPVRPRRR